MKEFVLSEVIKEKKLTCPRQIDRTQGISCGLFHRLRSTAKPT